MKIFNCDVFELPHFLRELQKRYKILFVLKDKRNASIFYVREF